MVPWRLGMSLKSSSIRVWMLSICLSLCAREAAAQVLYGSLTGNISDPSGAAVPNVRVEALNTGTGIARTASSDDAGSYAFNDLQAGLYRVTYTLASFRTLIQENVTITTNSVRRMDIKLEV